MHVPSAQCWPAPQIPRLQKLPHPSLAPQGLLSQLGAHVPVPHALSIPFAPHALPCVQDWQSESVPQRFRIVPQ